MAKLSRTTGDPRSCPTHKRRNRRLRRRVLVAALLAAVCWALFAVALRQPRHDRDWEFGFEELPSVTIVGEQVSIAHLRDYRLAGDGQVTPHFVDRAFRLDAVERAWFLVEPFSVFPFDDAGGMAHTYFAFDIAGQEPVTVSVEARRERGERFSAVLGALNEFELMYIWATEQDTTGKRVVQERHDVYMFPLLISREALTALFVRMATRTAEIERRPEFYNSLTSNCTSELALAANAARPGAIPVSIAWWLPGYSIEELYGRGYIPHDRPLAAVRARYRISETVRDALLEPDFSQRLRTFLTNPD